MWKTLMLVAGTALAIAQTGQAQISGQSGPIQIEADQLDFLDREGKAIYLGNVDAIQGDARIRAEKLTIFFDRRENTDADQTNQISGAVGDVRSLLAEGEVFYITATEKAKGDRGEYDYASDTITLTGNVTVTRGENVIVGDKLVIDLEAGVSRVSSESTRRGERVRTVIVTEGDN